MMMIDISKFMPDSAKSLKHASAVSLRLLVENIAEANGGKLISFEIPKPGTARVMVSGDAAHQAIIREFKKHSGVQVSEVDAIDVEADKNRKRQLKADKARARFKVAAANTEKT